MREAVRGRHLTKAYPGIVATDQVSVHVEAGEVLGLIGENGAGKTTLVRMLAGLERPDTGQILVRGRPVTFDGPAAARKLGIGMVLQHFSVVPTLTGLENLMLGDRSGSQVGLLRPMETRSRLLELQETHGFQIALDKTVSELTVGEQQQLEILKCLRDDLDVIILDEPTSVLNTDEIRSLLDLVSGWASENKAVILISHKLDELIAVSDRIVVMRQGRLVADRPTSAMTPSIIGELMVSNDADPSLLVDEKDRESDLGSAGVTSTPSLRISKLSVAACGVRRSLHDLNLAVHPGQIIGVAGIEGNGQRTLVDAVLGLIRPEKGRIELLGKDVTDWPPGERLRQGLSVIHEDRRTVAGVPELLVLENLMLRRIVLGHGVRRGIVQWAAARNRCRGLLREFAIKARLDNRYSTLSGGNQQRVVLARELSEDPAVLVAAHPTQGLDISGVEYVLTQLKGLRQRGSAILLISSDLDEIVRLADHIVVMRRGEIVGEITGGSATKSAIASLMVGSVSQ